MRFVQFLLQESIESSANDILKRAEAEAADQAAEEGGTGFTDDRVYTIAKIIANEEEPDQSSEILKVIKNKMDKKHSKK